MPVHMEASGSSITQSTSPLVSQLPVGSHHLTEQMVTLPEVMQKILAVYSGNTEESRLLTLTRLKADLKNRPGEDLIRVTRRAGTSGRPGGIEIATCRDCSFSGTFQKVAEHLTSQHWGLSLWCCCAPPCKLQYRRRHDLSRHHSEVHHIHTHRHARRIAADASRAGEHGPSQRTQAHVAHSVRSQRRPRPSNVDMSPIRSRLGPFDGGSSSASPPTPPAPSSSTSNPSTRVRLYQGGTTDQHQLRFVPPLVAGHTTLPSQRQDSHIRVPQVSHGQLGEDLYTFMHAMGGVHVPRQPAPQTSRPHPRHMGNQATSSVRGTSETLFDHDAGQQPSLGDSSNDILRYLNEGKDDSAEHRHAIRTVGPITNRKGGIVTSHVKPS